jgi:hypothetical protein
MVEVSVGEVIDKYTILDIKSEKIKDKDKLTNIIKEKNILSLSLSEHNYFILFSTEINELKIINEKLWDIEDRIRIKEFKMEFDDEFIELARSVYITNDIRFNIKNKINKLSNSNIVEEKSYFKY